MPLVLLSGLPCSGKTRRVAELVEYIQAHHSDKQVQVQACSSVSMLRRVNSIVMVLGCE